MKSKKKYLPAIAGLGVFVLAGAAAVGIAQADSGSADPESGTPSAPVVTDGIVTVQSFAAADFAAEAAELPTELTDAVERDLDMTGAEYLAQAAAAKNASDVIDALRADGVDVIQAELTGDGVTINVASDADVTKVEASGASAVVGAPEKVQSGLNIAYKATAVLPGGLGDATVDGGTPVGLCTSGFNGFSSSGDDANFTAGHCSGEDAHAQGLTVPRATGYIQSIPNFDGTIGAQFGEYVAGAAHFADGSRADGGVIDYTSGNSGAPVIQAWGGNTTSAPNAGAPIEIYGSINAVVGATVCKSGATSGWTCGRVLEADVNATINDGHGGTTEVQGITSSMCILSGDSGGAAVVGNYALGVDSYGSFFDPWEDGGSWFPTATTDNVCDPNAQIDEAANFYWANDAWAQANFSSRDALRQWIAANSTEVLSSGLFAVNSGTVSARSLYGDNFQLNVVVSAPAFTAPAARTVTDTTIAGTLANATADHGVRVSIDGAASTRVAVDAAGNWSLPVTGLSVGNHTVTATGVYGAGEFSTSAVTTATFEVVNVAPLVVTSPTANEVLTSARAPFTGTGEPGATVTVNIAGTNYGTATVSSGGTYTVTPSTDLPYGRYAATVTQDVTALGVSTSTSVGNLGRATAAPGVSIGSGSSVNVGSTLQGTGVPGAIITIRFEGTFNGSYNATVDASGNWSFVLPADVVPGTYTIAVVQRVADLDSPVTTVSNVSVVKSGANPKPAPSGSLPDTGFQGQPITIALGLIALGGLAVGGVSLARRRAEVK